LIIRDRFGKVLCDTDVVADLSGWDLRNADFSGQQIEGLYLADADLRGADFRDADMYWLDLFRANCENAIFRNSRLSRANLESANLPGADFCAAYVSYDNIGGAGTLENADLTGARLNGADLKGCRYNSKTIFPLGFDPVREGLMRAQDEPGDSPTV
jgi:uncharacterized protein YjbI with pentapeptide repeats